MIIKRLKTKICTTFRTANQFTNPNLINLFDYLSNILFYKIITNE